jgi:hypothetical protein
MPTIGAPYLIPVSDQAGQAMLAPTKAAKCEAQTLVPARRAGRQFWPVMGSPSGVT